MEAFRRMKRVGKRAGSQLLLARAALWIVERWLSCGSGSWRPVSESGRSGYGDAGHEGGGRCRKAASLPPG